MSCTQEEWQDLKIKELGGMVGKLFVRLENLEKVVDKFIGEIKGSASNSEKLREKLQNHKRVYGGRLE